MKESSTYLSVRAAIKLMAHPFNPMETQPWPQANNLESLTWHDNLGSELSFAAEAKRG